MTEEAVHELESDELPNFALEDSTLDGECAEATERTICQISLQKGIEQIDADVENEQPFHHRGELRKGARIFLLPLCVISIHHSHKPLPYHGKMPAARVVSAFPARVRVFRAAAKWLLGGYQYLGGFYPAGWL